MQKVLIVVKSQTEALTLSRILRGAGVTGTVTRPPRSAQAGSCSYAVRINQSDLQTANRRMQEKNFTPARIVPEAGT